MRNLRFAIFGTGFWARYQLAGWRELEGVECAALYNRTRAKAEALAMEFCVPSFYDDPRVLMDRERPDFIDIITNVETHSRFVHMAAGRGLPVICQKPMARNLSEAEAMVRACRETGTALFIHENWRWQTPVRALKRALDEGSIGRLFRARVEYCNSFPVFENQPFLKDLEQFILTDMGSHILDTTRFLFGEAVSVYCHTARVHPDIRGEDVATIVLGMSNGMTVVCSLSYASLLEDDRFPEVLVRVEGDRGSVELAPDYWVRTTTAQGTVSRRYPPPHYPWADPRYALVHSSIVPCNRDILRALRSEGPAETTGDDNFKTLRLVFSAYESASTGRALALS